MEGVFWRPACREHAGTAAGRTKAELLKLLRAGGALAGARSVLAYAAFQAQADDAARFLCANGVAAAAYHAGKHAKVRATRLRSLWPPAPFDSALPAVACLGTPCCFLHHAPRDFLSLKKGFL